MYRWISHVHTQSDVYSPSVGNVAMVVRKQSENPEDFFNKDFKQYQDGFEANGMIQYVEIQT